jgi:NodT family efflux transporter outer membrane factor (OMF) lipoprotein
MADVILRAPRSLVSAVVLACLAGCTVGPNYHTPATPVPDRFIATSAEMPAVARDKSRPPVAIEPASWWRALDDPELTSLIEEAVAAAPDVEIALTRLQEARTQEAVVLGTALPELEASGGAAKGTGSDLARGRASQSLVSAENTGRLQKVTQIVGFDAGWELDLFGKYRRELEAARYDTEAAVQARNAVLIAVVADVARAYVDMRGLQMRLAAARQNTAIARRTLDVVKARFDRGLTNELDLTLAQRQLASLEGEIAPFEAQIRAAQYTIAVLVGRFPEDMAGKLAAPGMIPTLPDRVAAGQPLDLLQRRPDIREAERQLAGATARIGVATANLFPHLAITGSIGMQGQGLGVSPATNNFIWSLGPSASWSLLDFGTLDAEVDVADLYSRELLLRYKQTILDAVRDVDSAIDDYAAQQDRLRHLGDALAASHQAVDLANQRYERGLTDFLNVTDAERQEYLLEDEYASAQQTAAEDFVALYRGLGGGWEQYQAIPPIRRPQPAVIAAFERLMAPADPAK